MKKITKILLTIIMIFTSILVVKADDPVTTTTNGEVASAIAQDYPYYEKAYKLIGAVSYYHDHAAVFDPSDQPDLTQVLNEALSTFGLDSGQSNNVMELYTAFKSSPTTSAFANGVCTDESHVNDKDTYNNFKNQLAQFNNLASMFKYAKNTLSSMVKRIDLLCENASCNSSVTGIKNQYETLIDRSLSMYSSFCDKLEDSPGIAHYLKSALQLVSYVALALAVILGALDFVKAITSHDDAALTKAFQSFVKRMVAVALIFMTYVIVELVLGLITFVPGTEASQLEVCEQIRLGALKG